MLPFPYVLWQFALMHEFNKTALKVIAFCLRLLWGPRDDTCLPIPSSAATEDARDQQGKEVSVREFLQQCQGVLDENGEAYRSHNNLKPLFFPCRTSHVRLFPKKHSFSYSYLLVGIPVTLCGYVGKSVLSVGTDRIFPNSGGILPNLRALLRGDLIHRELPRGRGWFSIEAKDYLYRSDPKTSLNTKLQTFLRNEGEDPDDYPVAYLVTAPRFLGYSFNPVSFWYLYGEEGLKAMILEVNNTFDERRSYLLKAPNSNADTKADLPPDETLDLGSPDKFLLSKVNQTSQIPAKFVSHWKKDFHVSPFNSRKGSYALSASNVRAESVIDNTITLKSSKGHGKLVARIFSTQDPIDPASFGSWDFAIFLASWWWVGFATFPRIVREAAKLFFKRRLHVWYRPEVLKDSLGRKETQDEKYTHSCTTWSRLTSLEPSRTVSETTFFM